MWCGSRSATPAPAAPIIARQSDLRIGADYSWNRGAAALINSGLLGR
jgi:hypothetical protein